MKYVVVFVSALAAFASANPVIATFVNEFGFHADSSGWVELHAEPLDEELDLTGWLVTTNTSACTLTCTLAYGDFMILDSTTLAWGAGRGAFRLNPAGDHIQVFPDSSHTQYADQVEFPMLPVGKDKSPLPPATTSASLLNLPGTEQLITWYIDSSPTMFEANDDYSTMTGNVSWAPSRGFTQAYVAVSGPLGGSHSVVLASGHYYLAQGLSAGRYEVTARGVPGNVVISYPESVDIGFSTTLYGIDLDFDPEAVAEAMSAERLAMNAGPTVLSGSSVQGLGSSLIFDPLGRRVLNSRSGVFFLREEPQASSPKPQAIRKVVITR